MPPRKPSDGKAVNSDIADDIQTDRSPRRFKETERRILTNLAKELPVNEGESLERVRLQVKWLENRLPVMAMAGNLRASRAEIRKKIRTVSTPLAKAIDALERLERICATEGPTLVHRSAYGDIKWMDGVEIVAILRRIYASCIEAEEWRTEQAKSKTKVRTQPIWMIASTFGLDDPRIQLGDGFVSIVEACYRAAGLRNEADDADLTRVIKQFMAERHRARKRLIGAKPEKTKSAYLQKP